MPDFATRRRRAQKICREDFDVFRATDTLDSDLPRFLLIQKSCAREYAVFGDSFEDVVAEVGKELLVGVLPIQVIDLDTGEEIKMHISTPVVTRSVA